MEIRATRENDYPRVMAVMTDWWGGRDLTAGLPRLFFVHFQDTSFIAEDKGELVAFLIGFRSQSQPNEAYIHFVGVHPDYRKQGLGQHLYGLFFDKVRQQGCEIVRCITGPVNKGSIAYHTRLGFEIEPGDGEVDSVPVTKNYDAKGDRVLFKKRL